MENMETLQKIALIFTIIIISILIFVVWKVPFLHNLIFPQYMGIFFLVLPIILLGEVNLRKYLWIILLIGIVSGFFVGTYIYNQSTEEDKKIAFEPVDDECTIERLQFICSTDDGFEISRYDMQKRGVGDIIGTKQSGISDLKIANIIDDYHILEVARKDCKMIFK